MKWRRRYWWRVYYLGALLAFAGLGWVRHVLLDFERQKLAARAEAERESTVRLALWRMDSWIAPLLARESARPYFEYLAFVPHDRAYSRLLNRLQPGEVYSPSPLLTFDSPYFPLHFQMDDRGAWSSPQVPTGNQLDLAQAGLVRPAEIEEKRALLDGVRTALPLDIAVVQMGCVATDWNDALTTLPEEEAINPAQLAAVENLREWGVDAKGEASQQRAKGSDYAQRVLQNFNVVNGLNEDAQEVRKLGPEWIRQQSYPEQQELAPVDGPGDLERQGGYWIEPFQDVVEPRMELGPFLPVWLPGATNDDAVQLAFLRNVRVNDATWVQGFAAHWPSLRAALLGEIADLFPGCEPDLEARVDLGGEEDGRSLAAIPAALALRSPAPPEPAGMTPARSTVAILWAAAVASLMGLGFSLRAGLAYADRRTRFASSVTHELRTPLTTFRMYTEMLADDVVSDPEDRRAYLRTLQAESDRLAVLVENVLAYARLEEGRTRPARERLRMADLADRHADALERRVRESRGAFRVDLLAPPGAALTTDAGAVGQVLFNLVDNACKYGRAGDAPPRVTLEFSVDGDRAVFRVSDDGPGVPPAVRDRIFRPFDRGAVRPEDENAGIGLGLALCRGLARDLGGELLLEERAGDDGEGGGARFRLELPLDRT